MASPADRDCEKVVLETFRKPKSSDADVQTRALQMVSQLPNPEAVRDKKGRTLLYHACKNDWSNVASVLMDKHTTCETLDPTTVCLAFTTTGIDQGCIMQLLSKVPNPEAIRDRDGTTLLRYACEKKWDNVAKTLLDRHIQCKPLDATVVSLAFEYPSTNGINQTCALQLLSQVLNPATVRDRYGTTLLHWACQNGWCDVVKVLVEKHGCDSSYQPGLVKALRLVFPIWSSVRHHSAAAIHWACAAGNFDIVKYLVEQGCDPMCRNFLGATPLHLACMNGHLDVVKFLVTEHHCNPLQPVTKLGLNWGYTPLHAACENCHLDVVAFLLSTGKSDELLSKRPGVIAQLLYKQFDEFSSYSSKSWWESKDFLARFVSCRRNNPFHPAFKIFVMGNPSVGKSTLVKAVQSKLTNSSLLGSFTAQFKKVSGVRVQTAGIIPVLIESENLACNIIMYDLAGQYQYYSSHAALLEHLVASPGALLMVVVDLSKSKEEILQTLEYWSSFIENCCSQNGIDSKPDVVIVGSHADIVKSSDVSLSTTPHKVIPLNCLQLASAGLSRVCSLITKGCIQFQQKIEIDLQVHFLFSFLAREFKGEIACTVSQIASRIAKEKNSKMEVRYHNTYITLLPQEMLTLSVHLTTLSENGWFLYLNDQQIFEDSWVILDQEVLLSEVNGTIFAPENFKEHYDISNSTGVVPFSKIEEAFPRHNPKMIIKFLTYLELCQQIAESEALVISEGQLGGSQQLSQTYHFFPALVRENRPEESCKSIEQTHYKCGWSLQCIRSNQFLSPRFLHVLLLRLAFSFALTPETSEEDKACPVVQRRCNVWKAGIHWQNRDGVEAIVEVVEQNTAVTVMMGCLKGREVACAELRSKVIQTVLESKERFCGAMELRESFIHPSELASYPAKSPQVLPSFTITELATAITQNKEVVTWKQGHGHGQQMLEISELLCFEPYASFNGTLLAEIFNDDNSEKIVPDMFHRDAGKFAHTNMDFFMQALDFNESEFEAAISHITTRPYRENVKHHCYLLFRTWALCSPNPTYQALRSALDRFSVFCGRNPLLLADQVPSKQSSVSCKYVSKPAQPKTKPTRKPLVQEAVTEDLGTTATHRSKCDKPLLQELQCLRGRGGRRVRVIEGVAALWEHLAIALGFESNVIEIVRRDMFHQSEDACREILRRWLEGQRGTRQPVNWATLVNSLLEAGFVDMVEDLQDLMD